MKIRRNTHDRAFEAALSSTSTGRGDNFGDSFWAMTFLMIRVVGGGSRSSSELTDDLLLVMRAGLREGKLK